jgi:hypothetical protein
MEEGIEKRRDSEEEEEKEREKQKRIEQKKERERKKKKQEKKEREETRERKRKVSKGKEEEKSELEEIEKEIAKIRIPIHKQINAIRGEELAWIYKGIDKLLPKVYNLMIQAISGERQVKLKGYVELLKMGVRELKQKISGIKPEYLGKDEDKIFQDNRLIKKIESVQVEAEHVTKEIDLIFAIKNVDEILDEDVLEKLEEYYIAVKSIMESLCRSSIFLMKFGEYVLNWTDDESFFGIYQELKKFVTTDKKWAAFSKKNKFEFYTNVGKTEILIVDKKTFNGKISKKDVAFFRNFLNNSGISETLLKEIDKQSKLENQNLKNFLKSSFDLIKREDEFLSNSSELYYKNIIYRIDASEEGGISLITFKILDFIPFFTFQDLEYYILDEFNSQMEVKYSIPPTITPIQGIKQIYQTIITTCQTLGKLQLVQKDLLVLSNSFVLKLKHKPANPYDYYCAILVETVKLDENLDPYDPSQEFDELLTNLINCLEEFKKMMGIEKYVTFESLEKNEYLQKALQDFENLLFFFGTCQDTAKRTNTTFLYQLIENWNNSITDTFIRIRDINTLYLTRIFAFYYNKKKRQEIATFNFMRIFVLDMIFFREREIEMIKKGYTKKLREEREKMDLEEEDEE